jgi:hypothetical protein
MGSWGGVYVVSVSALRLNERSWDCQAQLVDKVNRIRSNELVRHLPLGAADVVELFLEKG